MSIPGTLIPLFNSGAAGGGFQVSRSLRFNGTVDNSYLNRTPSVAGNRKTWTWSGWVKRCETGTASKYIFATTNTAGFAAAYLYFNDNNLRYWDRRSSGDGLILVTNSVFRDCSAWYHIVLAVDYANATSTNRAKLYVNGVEQTYSTASYPSTTEDSYVNAAVTHYIGPGTQYFDGYLANVQFIDGQALTPSSFTEVSATTGQLIPKAYSGSYGTNGSYLKFDDNSSNTATTLGKDTSGNGNNWTPNNLSVTAGAGNDSLVDTPTSYGTDTGVGGEVRGNYCTWNPLISTSGPISNGNLEMVGANAWRNTKGTISVSTGKWYFEATYTGSQYGSALGNLAAGVGFCKSNITTPNVDVNDSSLYGSILAFSQTGHVNNFNAPSSARSQIASGDVIGFALNYDAGTYTIYVNNTSTSSGSLNFTGELTPWTNAYYSGSYFILNTGQRSFAYTAPSGFKALCDTNLGAPVVAKPNTVMDVVLYSGNNSTQSITSLAFNPDMVWSKCRNVGRSHRLSDAIRGSNVDLYTDTTASDNFYGSGSITAFTANGFNLDNSASSQYNTSGETYVSWCWDAGTSTVSNTAGSITSQVRANASAGFSVVTWSGTNNDGTIGHGLGAQPALIIAKNRTSANEWCVLHSKSYNGSWGAGYLRQTAAFVDITGNFTGSNFYDRTAPTSSVFSVSGNKYAASDSGSISGQNYVVYAFAPVVGYSSFGSYTGNGSTDGPFVYTGFRPKWIMFKCSSSDQGGNATWRIFDAVRNPYNIVAEQLEASSSDAASSGANAFDFTSNGVKIRYNSSAYNASGATYIYIAFAENPFQYSRAR